MPFVFFYVQSDYEDLKQKIEEATQKSLPCPLTGEFSEFSQIERGNHQSIVKVLFLSQVKRPPKQAFCGHNLKP